MLLSVFENFNFRVLPDIYASVGKVTFGTCSIKKSNLLSSGISAIEVFMYAFSGIQTSAHIKKSTDTPISSFVFNSY